MTSEVSKTQIDRLGDRLRAGNVTEDDLRLLDAYRRSFSDAYEFVVGAIRKELTLEPTGRPAKSTTSISDKLRRESIRLTQIQDIAGCRLIAPDIANQNSVTESLTNLFEHTTVTDRRQQPSHGYRAVHVIVNCRGKLIETQVRTELQHVWAELSEKFSDGTDPAIKYGGGNKDMQKLLMDISFTIAGQESHEIQLADMEVRLTSQGELTDDLRNLMVEIQKMQEKVASQRQQMYKGYRNIIKNLGKKGGEDAISD